MKSKFLLKEKTTHGTAITPIALHHLSYEEGLDDFFYLHWHDEIEFLVVLEGEILYTYNDMKMPIKKGEGLFLPPNTLHAACSHHNKACEASVLLFHPSIFGSHQKEALYARYVFPILNTSLSFAPYLTPTLPWQREVLDILREIDLITQTSAKDHELWLRSRIYSIWHLCYQNAQKNINSLSRGQNYKIERMKVVFDYIEEHFQEEISLSDLAALLPMSEGQFCRTFKEVTNYTPFSYLIKTRILKACQLLSTSNIKIADIAKSTGFSNISYFNREFMKAIHCSPSHYRSESHSSS